GLFPDVALGVGCCTPLPLRRPRRVHPRPALAAASPPLRLAARPTHPAEAVLFSPAGLAALGLRARLPPRARLRLPAPRVRRLARPVGPRRSPRPRCRPHRRHPRLCLGPPFPSLAPHLHRPGAVHRL